MHLTYPKDKKDNGSGVTGQRSADPLGMQRASMLAVETHDQVSVKVNAPVDRGIAGVVAILNRLDGLYTLDSCEGIAGSKAAHVYFNYGDWQQLGRLMFEKIGPALWGRLGDEVTVSLEIFNESSPMGKLKFDKEATDLVASLLDQLL